MSSSVHGASAELIGEVSRRDGGVGDRASTPSSRCATPPMCSANRGRQSRPGVAWCCGDVVWRWSGKMSFSVHGASAELIGEVSRRDGGVGKYLFNQSDPLVTLCHSPYVLRKQGETIFPAGDVGSEIEHQPPRHFVPLPLYAPQTGGDNLASR